MRVLLKLQSFWRLTDPQMRAVCGLPPDDIDTVAQALSRYIRLPDVQTRLRLLMSIRTRLSAVYGDIATSEQTWLITSWSRLNDAAPLNLLRSTDISNVFRVDAAVRELAGA